MTEEELAELVRKEQEAAGELAPPPAPEQAPAVQTAAPVDGLARLAQLIEARQAQASGPGDAEREYLAQNKPQAGWKNVLGAVGSAIAESTGTQGAIDRFHKNQQMAEQRRRDGLEAARSIDLGRRPVDRSTAELGVMAGLSPEASASMTQDSPGLRLLNSGMGQLGARYKSMDLAAAKAEEDRAAREQMQQERFAQQEKMQAERLAAQEKLRKMGRGGGGGAPASPEQKAARLAAYLSPGAGVTVDQATAFVAGQTDGIPPDALERLKARAAAFNALPPKEQNALLKTTEAAENKRPDVLADAKTRAKGDVKERTKLRTELMSSKADVANAISAWNSMSPSAKQAFATIAGNSNLMSAIKSMQLSPEDRAHMGAIQQLGNALINARAGAAVSESEWGRIAQEMGWAANDYSVFNTTDGISAWLRRAKQSFQRRRDAVKAEYGEDLSTLPKAEGGGGG